MLPLKVSKEIVGYERVKLKSPQRGFHELPAASVGSNNPLHTFCVPVGYGNPAEVPRHTWHKNRIASATSEPLQHRANDSNF